MARSEFSIAADLAAALHDAGLFAASDDDLPIINCVQIVASEKRLTLTATDRYSLIERVVDCEGDGEWTALVRLADVKAIVTLLRRYKKCAAALVAADGTLVAEVEDVRYVATTPVDFEYPPTEKLWPTNGEMGVACGLDPARVGQLGKLTSAKDREPIVITFHGADKPCKFVDVADRFRGLLMPVRVQ